MGNYFSDDTAETYQQKLVDLENTITQNKKIAEHTHSNDILRYNLLHTKLTEKEHELQTVIDSRMELHRNLQVLQKTAHASQLAIEKKQLLYDKLSHKYICVVEENKANLQQIHVLTEQNNAYKKQSILDSPRIAFLHNIQTRKIELCAYLLSRNNRQWMDDKIETEYILNLINTLLEWAPVSTDI